MKSSESGQLWAAPTGVRGSLWRFGYLYSIILVAMPIALAFVFQNQIYAFWVEQFEGPGYQREYGFALERRRVTLPSGATRTLSVIANVTPGGRFDQLGVRSGDAIVCLYHGISDFYGQLALAREGYEARFRVLSPAQLDLGCDGGRVNRIRGRPLL